VVFELTYRVTLMSDQDSRLSAVDIFKKIEESRLLEHLAQAGSTAIVGDKETIDALRSLPSFADGTDTVACFYYDPADGLLAANNEAGPRELARRKAVIVASVNNEHTLFKAIRKQLPPHPPLLKLFSDLFVNLRAGRPLLESTNPPLPAPRLSYALITTPRSGSTAICEALESTGVAGAPREHLRAASQVLSRYCRLDYLRLLRIALAASATPNGVAGTKLIMHFLDEHLRSGGDFRPLAEELHFLHLVREDKVSQAISLYLARKTQIWHLRSKDALDRYQSALAQIDDPDAELEQIHRQYREILRQEDLLAEFFAVYRINPVTIRYEDFVSNPDGFIRDVLTTLGLQTPIKQGPPRVRSERLRTPLKQELKRRYLQAYPSA
jgi:LPS sulfotransferase NodH